MKQKLKRTERKIFKLTSSKCQEKLDRKKLKSSLWVIEKTLLFFFFFFANKVFVGLQKVKFSLNAQKAGCGETEKEG